MSYGELQLDGARARSWFPREGRIHSGIVFVSGVDGGFVEPADGIYQSLGEIFADRGVGSVFVEYTDPGVLEPSVANALAASRFLIDRGARSMALAGWSFGGAVISNTAPLLDEATTLVSFAAQAKDTESIRGFRGGSMLLIHDVSDDNVPFEAMGQIVAELPSTVRVREIALEGSDHYLTGKKDALLPEVQAWLLSDLSPPGCGTI